MQTYPLKELLDRYEILYPDNEHISDLRRTVIDKDIASIFRLCDPQPILRSAVLDKNLHSIFKLFDSADDELRKAVIEENRHSIFRIMEQFRDRISDFDDIKRATVEKNWHSLFRLLEKHDLNDIQDIKRAVLEKNAHSLFRLFGCGDMIEYEKPKTKPDWHIDDLRRAFAEDNLYSLFRLFPEDDEDINLYRTAIVNKNLRSIFKLLPANEDIRRAITEENLHSLFRLLKNDDLRKLILENNLYKVWPLLEKYVNTQFTAAFKNFFINNIEIDNDCFSRGQLQSKLWLVDELEKLDLELGTVFLCAGWYATLATMLFESNLSVDKIRSFDIDANCANIAETFNKKWFMDDWRFKASTVDIMDFEWSEKPAPSDGTIGNFYYMTEAKGKQVQMKDCPDTIINTSCEHISNFETWYDKIPKGKLVVLQSNNYFEINEHVNCVNNINEFKEMAPMSELHYMGMRELPKYTRFMLIGYK